MSTKKEKNKWKAEFFVCSMLDTEIKMMLSKSADWTAGLSLENANEKLRIIQSEDKLYIGLGILSNPPPTLFEINLTKKELLRQLKHYCPELDTTSQHIFILPQILIT